jgi:hypothetical protein
MEFCTSYLYKLLCKKAGFDTLRKAEQVIALCEVRYYLEENSVGQAIARYETWQNAFPEGIDSEQTPITLREICRIPDVDFCCMPWIYANVLQTLCAGDEPEEGEITRVQGELEYMAGRSQATWIWQNDSSYDSFSIAYPRFMKEEWVQEFLEMMAIPWPLTPAWYSKVTTEIPGEVIWPSGGRSSAIPIPASPLMEATPEMPELSIADPPKVRDAEKFWPFMRCKNVYKAYGGSDRLSHHDLLIWLAKKFKMPVDTLKKTDPYTMKILGIPKRAY